MLPWPPNAYPFVSLSAESPFTVCRILFAQWDSDSKWMVACALQCITIFVFYYFNLNSAPSTIQPHTPHTWWSDPDANDKQNRMDSLLLYLPRHCQQWTDEKRRLAFLLFNRRALLACVCVSEYLLNIFFLCTLPQLLSFHCNWLSSKQWAKYTK